MRTPQQLKNSLQRLNVHVTVNANATAAAKLDLDDSSPCTLRRRGRRRLWRVTRDRSRHRRDLDGNESCHGLRPVDPGELVDAR